MTVHIATLCDSATDYSGKLCILGAFDTLCAREFPVVHPQCSLAIRIGYDQADAGRHQMVIRCLDPEGKECLPPFQPVMDVGFPSPFQPFVTRNLVMNLQRVKFDRAGLYRFVIESDGRQLTTIPLRVTLYEDPRHPAGPAG